MKHTALLKGIRILTLCGVFYFILIIALLLGHIQASSKNQASSSPSTAAKMSQNHAP